ncbi:MAG: glycosyltransferase [Anaerolineales bacterium]
MRISILTYGTRGDVQPFIGLGRRLVEAGHRVQIATHTNFEAFVKGYGLDYLAVGGDATQLIRQLMNAGTDNIAFIKAWETHFAPIMEETMDTFWFGTQDADVYIFNPFGAFSHQVAEKRGVGCIRTALYPFARTRTTPLFLMPLLPLGGGYNAVSYDIYEQATQLMCRPYVNRWRKKHGMREHRLFEYPYNTLNGKPVPALLSYSEHLVPRPADWGAHIHATGFWWLDAPSQWQAPVELLRFLDHGDAPIYVGFGSLSGNDNYQHLIRSALEALRECGQRAILVSAWGELKGLELPPNVFAIDNAPHDWLFPRVKAVIHHGGAGTTSAGLRAGCPTIIAPYFGDQPFWGERVAALGVGSRAIPQQSLTAKNLAEAIHLVTTDPSIRKNACILGEKLRAEDGAKNAVAALESLV